MAPSGASRRDGCLGDRSVGHGGRRRKTSVYLPEDLKEALAREAARRGASEADVIRAALRAAVERPVPTEGLFDVEPFAERVDDLLDGFGVR